MAESLMIEGEQFSYRELSLAEFIDQYESSMPRAKLFEQTLPWLSATQEFMFCEDEQVIVHCLLQEYIEQESVVVLAWPLVHKGKSKSHISSLISFYSSVAEPIYFTETSKHHLQSLLTYITQSHPWKTMLLGSFTEGNTEEADVTEVLTQYFPYQRTFSKTENIYQQGICDYDSYYQQIPSQLRNIIKRREKKLAKRHQYRTEIISEQTSFTLEFSAYKEIYRQSWKGDEASFEFIKAVCLAALEENKLRLGILYVDDEPAAAQIWFLQTAYDNDKVEQTTASIFKLAYTPKYQGFSVGSILSLALSEHVIDQDNVSSIEFGMGSEAYKKDWLSANRIRKSYQVFNSNGIYGKLLILSKLLLPRLAKRIINAFKGKAALNRINK